MNLRAWILFWMSATLSSLSPTGASSTSSCSGSWFRGIVGVGSWAFPHLLLLLPRFLTAPIPSAFYRTLMRPMVSTPFRQGHLVKAFWDPSTSFESPQPWHPPLTFTCLILSIYNFLKLLKLICRYHATSLLF